jgi:hypothetical protein
MTTASQTTESLDECELDEVESHTWNVRFIGNRASILVTVDASDEDEAIRLAEQDLLEELGLKLRGWDVDVDEWVPLHGYYQLRWVTGPGQPVGHIHGEIFNRKRDAVAAAKRLQAKQDVLGNSAGQYIEVRDHARQVVFKTTTPGYWEPNAEEVAS